MLARAVSYGLMGIDGFEVTVEVNLSQGLPSFEIVGLPDAAVRESKERVRTAMKNSGFGFPEGRITVNLAPADMRKEGPAFDLPIAVGLLAAWGKVDAQALSGAAFFGEMALDGALRGVRGALPLAVSARAQGVKTLYVPAENARELRCVAGVAIYPVTSLKELSVQLQGDSVIEPIEPVTYETLLGERRPAMDLAYVRGQKAAKRALEIAAAGGHNVLMVGPPGSGKTLLARCLPTILPDMTFEEALEVTRIHSAAGAPPETGLLIERPFRAPHHSASQPSLIGGGSHALPGEISKAHSGVLFLDELPEYRRDVLESLRQPMEDGFVTVARAAAQSTYPSQFMLVCSMNPCPCGNYGSRLQPCRCTQMEIRKYLSRISGPLLDRIDLHIQVDSVDPEAIADNTLEEPSSAVRARVEAARALQRKRYEGAGIPCNARLDARTIGELCPMREDARNLLLQAGRTMGLSSRAFTRVMKVSRTIADLAGREYIEKPDVAEAIRYRSLDRKYWG